MSGAVAMVGFMGAGKSTVAREAAVLLALPFVDTDAVLVTRHGAIDAIFAERGEAAFRALERDVVCEALGDALMHPAVVALGGGAVTIDDVREALSRLAHVVWIDAPLALLYARARVGDSRPLARDRAAFDRLYAERRPLYEAVATHTVTIAEADTVQDAAVRVAEAVR